MTAKELVALVDTLEEDARLPLMAAIAEATADEGDRQKIYGMVVGMLLGSYLHQFEGDASRCLQMVNEDDSMRQKALVFVNTSALTYMTLLDVRAAAGVTKP